MTIIALFQQSPGFPLLQAIFSYSDESQVCAASRFCCIANVLFHNISLNFIFARTLPTITLAHLVLDLFYPGFKPITDIGG